MAEIKIDLKNMTREDLEAEVIRLLQKVRELREILRVIEEQNDRGKVRSFN